MKPATWPRGASYTLDGMSVHVSAPVLVAQAPIALDRDQATDRDASGSYLWYPQVARTGDGELVAIIRLAADNLEVDALSPIGFSWSGDGGLSWSPLLRCNRGQGYVNFLDHRGDLLHLPFILYADGDRLVGPLNVIPKGRREVEFLERGVTVSGLPRRAMLAPWLPDYDLAASKRMGLSGMYFNGQMVLARDGKTFLATVYGTLEGDQRCRIVCLESSDGRDWRYRSTIVAPDCAIGEHPWSNSENAICRLADGRIICVFRIEGVTYGRCWSADDGRTWSEPESTRLSGHAEPSLALLPSGPLVLGGGRPGITLWFSRDGSGSSFQAVDIFAHHESLVPEAQRFDRSKRGGGTCHYTEVIAVDRSSVLFIYDCYRPDHQFGIYVVRAAVEMA